MVKQAHILLFDGYMDWEPALLLAELRRSGGFDVHAIGFDSEPATSKGGLRVLVERALVDVSPEDFEFLILPGGDLWEVGDYPREAVHSLVARLEAAGTPIAAICGATIALARAGVLDARRHTSNLRDYLVENAREYSGQEYYVDELSVRDRGVITASGLGHVEFARDVLAEAGVFSEDDLVKWYDAYKHGRYTPLSK
jgi:putative intracellular protease/amidase